MVFILRSLICLITLGPRIARIELVIWKKLNKMQFRYWGANNCGYKCMWGNYVSPLSAHSVSGNKNYAHSCRGCNEK